MNLNQVWPEWSEESLIGKGSFGSVYKAKRVDYGKTFYSAIKVLSIPKDDKEIETLKRQGMSESEIRSYFQSRINKLLNEITVMDKLKGAKNIVGIEDYKIVERTKKIGWDIFIRMELLNTFDSFKSKPNFTQKDVIQVGIDICTALESCEQYNIIHRDIKPDNIFISRFGEYKLGDFGIAKQLEITQADMSRTGTINYMAPEVYKGEKYNSNVDIYSLGLVLYGLLNNNRVPFLPQYPQPITDDDQRNALNLRMSGCPIPYPCMANNLLSTVITKAIAYNKNDRYKTATEFKNDLIKVWNVLVQQGDNSTIFSDNFKPVDNSFSNSDGYTNDMTDKSKLIAGDYFYSQDNTNNNVYNSSYQNYINKESKSNKLCKILSYPSAVIMGAFATILYFKTGIIDITIITLLAIMMNIFVANTNRVAIGLCSFSTLAIVTTETVLNFISLMNTKENIVPTLILLLSLLLALLGSMISIFQSKLKISGSLFLYAIVIEWLFNIYSIIDGSYSFNIYNISINLIELTMLLWSNGYDVNYNKGVSMTIRHIITYIISGVIFVFNSFAIYKMFIV